MARIPRTRYPLNIESSYAKNINQLVNELDSLVLYEFDKIVAPEIDKKRLISDDSLNDSILNFIKNAIAKIKGLFLGALSSRNATKSATKFANSLSSVSKSNMNAQFTSKGINPINSEPWLKSYLASKVAENVSYITNIRDDYSSKIEQIIYRGVTNGQSSAEMREELIKQTGMARKKADFIARDQTGSMLGQMTAKRHQEAGIKAFRWSDSGDSKVRDSHRERDGKIYYYAENPLLPGEEYNCRCVEEPVFDDELAQIEAEQALNELTENEEYAINTYISSEAYRINDKLRNDYDLDEKDSKLLKELDSALSKMDKFEGDLNRSYNFRSQDDLISFVNSLEIGKRKTFDEYISTSIDIYDSNNQLLLIIKNAKNGRNISHINENELEVLYERGSEFIVKERYRLETGVLVIELEEFHD